EAENRTEADAELPDRGRNLITGRADMKVPVEVKVILEIVMHQRGISVPVGKEALVKTRNLVPVLGRDEIWCGRRHVDLFSLVIGSAIFVPLHEDRTPLFLRLGRPALVQHAPQLDGDGLLLA